MWYYSFKWIKGNWFKAKGALSDVPVGFDLLVLKCVAQQCVVLRSDFYKVPFGWSRHNNFEMTATQFVDFCLLASQRQI